ncbi:MAG: D-2-hydroxyacid dehydrogenase (NADP+) [Alphaproteobacteria bacterium]|jgi:D-2-hydroxyacid dehydrogenase (NADP+)
MKIVAYLTNSRFDLNDFGKRFPDHQFIVTRDLDSLIREIPDAEVFIASNRPYLPDMVSAVNNNAKQLKWIQFTTSGIDKALRSGGFPKGVIVTNTAGMGAPMLAEHVFFLCMAVGRRIRDTESASREHKWIRDEISPSMIGMTRKTLCIIGMGATGQEAAKRAKAFSMEVLGVSRAYEPDALVDEVFPRERVKEALARADFILLSMPSTAETKNFINDDTLSVMKKTAIIVNVARGALIDEDALIRACTEGRICGAGLDVTQEEPTPADSPLWDVPNIIITPHIAGTGGNNTAELFDIMGDNLERYLAGKPLTRVLDWENMKPE